MSQAVDWLAIEGHYRAGVRSLRDIAQEFGVPESTIRHRAKKLTWIQDAAGTKRSMVSRMMAGVAQDVAQNTMRNIEDAAAQDVADMQLGLVGARKALTVSVAALDTVTEPRDIKVLSECIKLNVETIRTIRELDNKPAAGIGEGIRVNVVFAQQIGAA